jgi:MFS family permease
MTTVPWAAGAFVGSAIGGITMARFGRRVLHAGLIVETVGLLAIYVTLRAAGAGVGSLELLPAMLVGGVGMGMVFVPLFDIVMAGVEPHEMGSASGVLKTVDGLAMSLGVAGLGSVFFAIAGHGGAGAFLSAAEWVALATAGLLALAFVIAFRLPRHARQMPSQPDPSGDGARVAPLAPELAAA